MFGSAASYLDGHDISEQNGYYSKRFYEVVAISPEMQIRLDKIDTLIQDGHTLNKKWGYYPDLKNSSGKSINIFGGLLRFSGPAGFSWIAFFFPWAVCAQIKEWSFFYFVGIFSLMSTALSLALDSTSSIYEFLTCYFYANMFPYMRYMAKKSNVQEYSKPASIAIGLLLMIVALLPARLIEIMASL